MIVRRVVVATAAPGAAAALATAVELARAMHADLRGVFVESTDLLALATLPFAGEVGFPSPGRRALDVESMQRGLRAQARRVERELASVVAGRPLRWSFDVVRSRMTAELFAEAGATDLAVVAWSRAAGATAGLARALRAFRGATVPLLLVAEHLRRPLSVAVVPPPSFDPAVLADALDALWPRYGRAALIVDVAPASARREALRRRVDRLLAGRGLAPRFRRLGHALDLPALVALEAPRLIVPLIGDEEDREAAVDALECPVLLLPAARRGTTA